MGDFEQVGGVLTLEDGRVKFRYPDDQKEAAAIILDRLRAHREEVTRLLQGRSARTIGAQGIPAEAVLIAPKFDSKPLKQVPSCWCCAVPYKVDRVQEWQGKQYAHLEPGCHCLDVPQALSCCGLCVAHCPCKGRSERGTRG